MNLTLNFPVLWKTNETEKKEIFFSLMAWLTSNQKSVCVCVCVSIFWLTSILSSSSAASFWYSEVEKLNIYSLITYNVKSCFLI